MAEPAAILVAIAARFFGGGPLAGLRAIVTSGPTREPIDPVRYIANRSSGRQGPAIAAALAAAGAEVTLVSGPVEIAPPAGVRTVRVLTAREMQEAVEAALPADIAVMAAAVADWRVEESAEKIKKSAGGLPNLMLTENPDILAGLARNKQRPRLLIGFAAETGNLIANAQEKLRRKGCDWIVANDVSPATGVMGGTRNRVHLVSKSGVEDWPEMSKAEVAERLVERIASHLPSPPAGEGQGGGKGDGGSGVLPPSPSLPRKGGEGALRDE
jgi:phosphopantothenoylcysteine decarboxylase/phosphopantothenate--cysteine ligase